jgi:tRNA(fMet)-specific endonuclease VapC
MDSDRENASHTHGRCGCAALRISGNLIGADDLFIAAHARNPGLTLVTNNTREFGRVQGLQIKNWIEPIG